MNMIDQFINFVIRPPRAEYNPDQYLWESEFTLAGRKYHRHDLELSNERGHTLQCSHYVPAVIPENTSLPCVIYCHGNSGCRADANEAAVILLPSNITVFVLDFAGSGLSGGDFVSLGWHEKDDLKVVVSYLRSCKQVSCIGLWGRSMGAVTSLLYGAEDPSIAGMVLDSAFSNLYDLMMELVDVYKIRLPKFTIKMAIQYMRRVIQKKAKFDIMDLKVVQFAPKSYIPALFGHATDDIFIQPRHSDLIFKSYGGDKNIIKFEGDHNSPRPQFYYDSVSIFFYNVLRPPPISSTPSSKPEKYYDLGNFRVGAGTDESLLYEIITGLRAESSSSAPGLPHGSGTLTKSVVDLLPESVANLSVTEEVEFLFDNANSTSDVAEDVSEDSHKQAKVKSQNEECCSNSSSNRASWGRCSSLGARSEASFSPEHPEAEGSFNTRRQRTIRALATPLRRIHGKATAKLKEKKKKKQEQREVTDKTQTLRQRLKLCFLGRRPRHKRQLST